MTRVQEHNNSKTKPEWTQMLELADKDIKTVTITTS